MRFRRRDGRLRDGARVEITSLVDVVFLLLIFLLVSTTFKKREHAFEIRLPRAAAEEVVVQTDVAMIFVGKGGSFAFLDPASGGGPINATTADELVEQVKSYVTEHPDAPLRVRAEKDTPYQKVIDAVGLVRKAGGKDLQLEYEKAPGPDDAPAEP